MSDDLTVDGKVGIGTEAPASTLHISSGSSGDCMVIIEADTDNSNESGNQMIIFRQDGGIDVSAVHNENNALHISNSISSGGIVFNTNYSTTGYTNAVERMRIDTNGNIGIGTDSPTRHTFEVVPTPDTVIKIAKAVLGSRSDVLADAMFGHETHESSITGYAILQDTIGRTYLNSTLSQPLHLCVNDDPSVISGGDVGIGTNNPTAVKLDVNGSLSSSVEFKLNGLAEVYDTGSHIKLYGNKAFHIQQRNC